MKHIVPMIVGTCALALSLSLAPPAEAKGRNGHGRQDRHRVEQRHRHQDRHRDHRRYERRDHYRHERRHVDRYERRHQRFDVPHRIYSRHQRSYRPYFERSVYFAPHRHRHAVYSFPVFIDGYRTYRRHDYCEGELFRPHGSVGFEGRRWGVRFDF